MRLILGGDYAFMTSWLGRKGASSCMPCLKCTALRRRTQRNGLLEYNWGNMQDGNLARGVVRTHTRFEEVAKFADGGNGARASTMALDEHFSIEDRPLLVVDPSHISTLPLHLTLRITGDMLRVVIGAVYCHHGQARACAYAENLALALRFVVGVAPKPYFGGAFEGRQCQLIVRRLSAVFELLAAYVPAADAAAYGAECGIWAELLQVLTQTAESFTEDAKSFRADTARYVDGLCAAFAWFSVTPKLHTLCCHAPDFLDYFGSLGCYSEQGLELWHGHFNKNAAQHPADSCLGSCLSYIKRSAVSRAPGNASYHRGAKRSLAKAGPGAQDAKTPLRRSGRRS